MNNILTPQEIQVCNDIGNIKAITCSDKVELFNDLPRENTYTLEITSLPSHTVTELKRCGLNIKSIFVMPNTSMMHVRLVKKNRMIKK